MNEHNLPATTARPPVPAERAPAGMVAEAMQDERGMPGDALKRIAAVLLRYKWMILALAVVGTAGAAYVSRYLPLRYQAEATLWFQLADRSATAPIQTQGNIGPGAWMELLRSYYILDRVAAEQTLYLNYTPRDSLLMRSFRVDSTFFGGRYRLRVDAQARTAELETEDGQRLEHVRAGEPIGRSRGFIWQPPASAFEPRRVVKFEVMHPREAARQLSRRLTTGLPRGGNVVTLRYWGNDPVRVAATVNGIADLFTETAVEFKASQQGVLSEALIKQLATAQENLTSAERALEDYRIQTATLPSEAAADPEAQLTQTPTLALNAYTTYTVQRDNTLRDLEAIRRMMTESTEVSVDALTAVPAIARAPEVSQAVNDLASRRVGLRTLLQTYTPEHPQVVRALTDIETLEKRTIPQLAARLAQEMEYEAGRLDSLIASTAYELRAIPTRTLEEARLRRSVQHAERLYNDLRFRYETAQLAREATMPEVRILDRAHAPVRPQMDPRLKLVGMGFLASFGFGVLLAFALDRLDPKLRYADQVSRDLGLSIIGAVPDLARSRNLAAGNSAEVLEALRGVRLNLIHAHGSAGPIRLTVTSPGSGDGKTFLVSNLALSFAELGYRTLVIDGDTRRSTLHRVFSLDRKPGLTDFLAGHRSEVDVIRQTNFPLVHVIAGGQRMANAPELLASARMGDLLAYARSEYDVILLDSPPLSAGVDPLVLATLSANVVIVMRTGLTNRAIADAKLAMLERLPVRILGAVLNGFDSGDAYRYYSYLPGYESQSEVEPPVAESLQPT